MIKLTQLIQELMVNKPTSYPRGVISDYMTHKIYDNGAHEFKFDDDKVYQLVKDNIKFFNTKGENLNDREIYDITEDYVLYKYNGNKYEYDNDWFTGGGYEGLFKEFQNISIKDAIIDIQQYLEKKPK